ncbi:DUF6907 domain-containing protein [Actinacidiphila glaucinigra]|uniref:DUF6907 domain-containing protein n=1 Tax=Actinacidiphila glaucinigra TaxID=235986 RepID=UPI0037124E61
MAKSVPNPVNSADDVPALPKLPKPLQSVDVDQPIPFKLTPAAEQLPRTWTFINRYNDQPITLTCMVGCTANHDRDMERAQYPEDIWCQTNGKDVMLPINVTGTSESYRVLRMTMNCIPFSSKMSERLPHVTIEMIDDHWIDGLDPDGLATVISTLSSQLDRLREAHATLIDVRAEYRRHAA